MVTETASPTAPRAHAEIVTSFFRELEAGNVDAAMGLMTEDAVWINVTLPTVRGRRRIDRVMRALLRGGDFRAHVHAVAEHDDTVLVDRTDELALGPLKQRFWVYGRFELRDGKIAVWRDAFDWLDITVSLVRAVAGVISPALNRRWPGDE